jgi:hypothetical protein
MKLWKHKIIRFSLDDGDSKGREKKQREEISCIKVSNKKKK